LLLLASTTSLYICIIKFHTFYPILFGWVI
jgi:hypothetical protein